MFISFYLVTYALVDYNPWLGFVPISVLAVLLLADILHRMGV
jgi:hypothetical protein